MVIYYEILNVVIKPTVNINIPLPQPNLEPLLQNLVQGVGGHALPAYRDGGGLQLVDGMGLQQTIALQAELTSIASTYCGGHRGQYGVVFPGFVSISRHYCGHTDLDRQD